MMITNTLDQNVPSFEQTSKRDNDPWQSARVVLYFDSIGENGERTPGLLDQTWQQVARLIDVRDALRYDSYISFLEAQSDEATRQAIRERVESQGEMFDESFMARLRSMCLGAAACEDFVIIRAASEALDPNEYLGGWEPQIAEMVDIYARLGLARQIGVRIERSRLDSNGLVIETRSSDRIETHY